MRPLLLDDIASYLASEGIGVVGTDLFKGQIPDSPDNCVAIFEYAGQRPETTHDNATFEHPGLQVRVRNLNYANGRQKIHDVFEVLHGLCNTNLSSTFYLSIFAIQSPESIGRDENDRVEFVQNFAVTKT
jgi:hypothetical protein